jgi:hypothetical protein
VVAWRRPGTLRSLTTGYGLRTTDFLGRGQDQCGQATKGVWGMSRRQKAMKGVEDCDKPGGAVKRALSPGCPNYRALNP